MLKIASALLAVGLTFLMSGCAESEDTDFVLYPPKDHYLQYWMYPNDAAISDSVDANLARGVILEVHPNATYTLSFDADTVAGAPKMHLFRIGKNKQGSSFVHPVRLLEASLEEGRYVYRFLCEENDAAEWAVTLEKGKDFYKGSTKNVRLTGDGAYSDHLSLNLVLVGNVAQKLDGFTEEELATAMLANFRKFYTGIVIDTLYVNHAENHPVVGDHYPANQPWVAGRSDDDTMMQSLGGGWPGAENALDLVLTHYIDEEGLMGYSYLFSGNLGRGEASTVVLGAHVKTANGSLSNSMNDIIETAVHESGHFLGLRHTSSTTADLYAIGDYSVVEDGFTDTPYCKGLLSSGLVKEKSSSGSDMKIRHGHRGLYGKVMLSTAGLFDINTCPDVDNLMFPVETETEYAGLTPQQQEMVRKTLMIYPH